MIQFSIKTERFVGLLTVVAFVIFILLKQCSSSIQVESQEPKITVVRDTVWQTKIDTFKVQNTRYKMVYVATKDSTILKNKPQLTDSISYLKAKAYQDTLSNNDIEIYSYNLVEGNLLESKLAYQLKVPREITITKTIEHPKTYKSGLYLFSEVGGNAQQFDNLSLGLQYNRKGNWFLSYRINLNQFNQATHNVGVGWRIIK